MRTTNFLTCGLLLGIITSCEDNTLYTPTDLTADMISASEVQLAWRDRTTGEDGYLIELKTGKGHFVTIGKVAVNVTTFIDVDLIKGTKYTYKVYAFRNQTSLFHNMEYSYPDEVSITP